MVVVAFLVQKTESQMKKTKAKAQTTRTKTTSKKSAQNFQRYLQIAAVFVVGVLLLGVLYLNTGAVQKSQDISSDASTGNTANQNSPMSCSEAQLTNIVIRGNVAYVRYVPLRPDGSEIWGQATPFTELMNYNTKPNALPGSGTIQSYNAFIHPATSEFAQHLVRGNRVYSKVIPTTKGKIDWGLEARTGWKDATSRFKLPTGTVQEFGMYATMSGDSSSAKERVTEYVKVDGKSYILNYFDYYRNSNLYKTTAPKNANYTMQTDLRKNPAALPGRGDITAQSDYINFKQNMLKQDWIRGDLRYKRDVPLKGDGSPDYSRAGQIVQVQNVSANSKELPGGGAVQTMVNFINCKTYSGERSD